MNSDPTSPHGDPFLLLRQILSGRTIPPVPESVADCEPLAVLCRELIVIREVLSDFARGNLDKDIELRGGIAGNLKTLQANLRHLAWQVQQVAQGDFSQRVDFMGDFSKAFNSMVVQLDQSLTETRENESQLLQVNLELQDEIRQRLHTERVLQQSEQRWNLAVQCSRDGIWDINLHTKEAWYSDRFLEMFEFEPEDLPKDLRWDRFIHPSNEAEAEFIRQLMTGVIPPREFSLEYRTRKKNGDYFWIRSKGIPVPDEDRTPQRMIGVASDISLQKETERGLAYQAMHDNLTGLPNRYLMEDRLRRHVARSRRTGNPFALVTLDLDNFKGVNDTWGHHAGDVLLIELADRIKKCIRDTDTAARLGGDEFLFLYDCPRGHEIEVIKHVLGRLYELFEQPVDLGPTIYYLNSSAGIAFFPTHTEDTHELFELADAALYRAKDLGKNVYVIWQPDLPPRENS